MNDKETVRYKTAFVMRPYTGLQLRKIYGISRKTFKKWIERIEDKLGPRNGYYYSIEQVEIIVYEWGLPGWLDITREEALSSPLFNIKTKI